MALLVPFLVAVAQLEAPPPPAPPRTQLEAPPPPAPPRTQVELLRDVFRSGLIPRRIDINDNRAAARALRRIDRGYFVLPVNLKHAYEDRPLPINFGATISAPHMHAIALGLLAPKLRSLPSRLTLSPPKVLPLDPIFLICHIPFSPYFRI